MGKRDLLLRIENDIFLVWLQVAFAVYQIRRICEIEAADFCYFFVVFSVKVS